MNAQNIPRDLKYAAMQSILDNMKARDAKYDEILNRQKQIDEEFAREINEFLGSKSKDYKTFYEKRMESANYMRPKFTPTPEGGKAESESKKTRLAEAGEFFKNLGVNLKDLKSIRNKYQEELRLVIDKAAELTNSKEEGL